MCSRFLLFLRLWPAFWPLHSCGSVQTAVFYCGLSGFTVAEICDRRLQILPRPVLRAMQGAFPVSEFFRQGCFPSPLPRHWIKRRWGGCLHPPVSAAKSLIYISYILYLKFSTGQLIASPTGLCGNPCRGGYYPPVSADTRNSALFCISTGRLIASPAKPGRCATHNSFCRISPFPCLARYNPVIITPLYFMFYSNVSTVKIYFVYFVWHKRLLLIW